MAGAVAVADVPACETITVRDVTPEPLTVIVAVREVAAVLAVTVTVPLLLPVVGATVAHVWSTATVQPVMFDVTLNDCEPAAVEKSSAEVEMFNVGVGDDVLTVIENSCV